MKTNEIRLHFLKSSWTSHYLPTYIIDHYNSLLFNNFSFIYYWPSFSHHLYVVCVNFIHKWRDLQFEVNFERHIFWETFHGNFYFLSEFFCQKSAESKSPQKYYSYFVLMSGLGYERGALQSPPNSLFFGKCFKKTTEYFLKFLFFIWKYNPSGSCSSLHDRSNF